MTSVITILSTLPSVDLSSVLFISIFWVLFCASRADVVGLLHFVLGRESLRRLGVARCQRGRDVRAVPGADARAPPRARWAVPKWGGAARRC